MANPAIMGMKLLWTSGMVDVSDAVGDGLIVGLTV